LSNGSKVVSNWIKSGLNILHRGLHSVSTGGLGALQSHSNPAFFM
jgi:hypothetical protein